MGMATGNLVTLLIVGLLVIGGVSTFAIYNMSTTGTVEATTETAQAQVDVAGCNGGTSVTETIKVYDKEKPGTLVTSGNNWFITPTGLGNQSISSMSLGTQTEHSVLIGWLSTSYYPAIFDFKTGCNKADRVAYLEAAGTQTITAVNDDGITKNGASAQQTVDASDTREFAVLVDAPTNTYFGAGDCNVVVASFDKTYFSSAEVYAGGNLLEKVGTPSPFNYFNASYDGSAAYKFAQIKNGEKLEMTAKVVSTTSNPDGTTGGIRFNFYDCGGDINALTGAVIFGVEDEDSHELSLKPQNLTVYVQ